MKSFFKFIAKLIGWKVGDYAGLPDKCVIAVAPHTSNWDLPLGLVMYTSLGNRASFLIKKTWFFFPMNLVLKVLGGVPVDRTKNTSLIHQMAEVFNSRDKFQLAITPEGTRKYNPNWKRGFYYIALEAKVPIVVVAFDYKRKVVDFKKILMPSGDIDTDMAIIKDCYKGVTARFPENFAL